MPFNDVYFKSLDKLQMKYCICADTSTQMILWCISFQVNETNALMFEGQWGHLYIHWDPVIHYKVVHSLITVFTN